MTEKRKFKPISRTILDFGKLALYAEKLEGGERRPQFTIKPIRGFLFVMVRTGLPTDVNNGYMSLKLSLKNYYALMVAFEMLLNKKIETVRITGYGNIYDEKANKYSEEQIAFGAVKIARDDDDKIFISLVIDKRPLIQFYFGKEYDSSVKKEGGNELTDAEYSQLYGQAYYMMLNDFVGPVLVRSTKEIFEDPFEAPRESQPPEQTTKKEFEDIDDDIPF